MNKLVKQSHDYSLDGYQLHDYQNQAVEFILSKFNVLLNLQPGTGKTLISLSAAYRCIQCSKDLQVVILCPKQAVSSFKKELSKKLKVSYSIHTTEESMSPQSARFHIFVYSRIEELVKYVSSHNNPIMFIVDEIHKLSNKTKTTEKIFSLRKRFNFVVGLTGTPLQNKPDGLYNIVNFVSPGFLKDFVWFSNNFLVYQTQYLYRNGRKVKIKKIVGLKNAEVLSNHLSKIVLTKTRSYNMDFQYRSCYMNDEERKEYVKAAKGILDDDLDDKVVYSARLHNLQRVVDGSLLKSNHLHSKEKLLIQSLSEVLSRNESCLVYCEYEDTYKRLVSIIEQYKYVLNYSQLHLITGKIKFEDRVKVESNMPLKSIVIMTRAGSASINLQAANNIIFYSTPFSLSDVIQAIGRITRVDTKFDIQHVYFLELCDTIDTYKRLMVESKVSTLQALFGDTPTLPKIEEFDIDYKELKKFLLWKKW